MNARVAPEAAVAPSRPLVRIASLSSSASSGRRLKARIFWLHDTPLATRAFVTVRIGTAETRGTILAIANALDPGDRSLSSRDTVGQNHVGEVEIA
jgi:bifunctional enzyme CysN/CysC